jgi:hypothetical protein
VKIKIKSNGGVMIEKMGNLKDQFCPYQNETVQCGDWCPLFLLDITNLQLHLCKKTYNYSELLKG